MGAERITEERMLPLFVSQTSGSTQLPLRCHEYVLYQVIHPPPLFHPKLCPTRGTLKEDKRQIWANKNVTKTKKRENAELFFLCPHRFFCGVRGIFRDDSLFIQPNNGTF